MRNLAAVSPRRSDVQIHGSTLKPLGGSNSTLRRHRQKDRSMNVNIELLRCIERHGVPMSLTSPADVANAIQLKERGLIDATVSRPSKLRSDYGAIELVVVRSITQAGRIALGLPD